MNKKFQIFVSSTYEDLKEERSEVMQALLELDCMPAGMELFPAASEEQWSWIKKVIEESDYYLVIIANRYGSLSENTGMSFTEMEYRYAVDIGIPVIAFLHENPTSVESGKSEHSQSGRKKLDQFRKLCEKRLVKYWNSPTDLGAKASRSITQLIKHEPAIGWVRADQIPEEQSAEILRLKNEVESLRKKLKELTPVLNIPSDLAQGGDTLKIDFSYETKKPKKATTGQTYWIKGDEYDDEIETTWDELFAYLSPELISPTSEYHMIARINSFIRSVSFSALQKKHKNQKIERFSAYSDPFDKIKVQYRALGLIAINETNNWYLTELGDAHMNNLLSVKKE